MSLIDKIDNKIANFKANNTRQPVFIILDQVSLYELKAEVKQITGKNQDEAYEILGLQISVLQRLTREQVVEIC